MTKVIVPQLGIIAMVEFDQLNAYCMDEIMGPNVFHTKYCIQHIHEKIAKMYHRLCKK